MKRLVDIDALIRECAIPCKDYYGDDDDTCIQFDVDDIEKFAKIEINTGSAMWKKYGNEYACSNCGIPAAWCKPRIKKQDLSRFCPSCGFQMNPQEVNHE